MLSESISHFEFCTIRNIVSHWTLYNYVTVLCENLSLLIEFVMFGVLSLLYFICSYTCMILKPRLSWDMTSSELVINCRCFDGTGFFFLSLRRAGHYRCEHLRDFITCIYRKGSL